MPLKAICEGKPTYAWELTESARSFNFSCPHCNEKLIPVLPKTNIIKHFRHYSGTAHGEPESLEHETGKMHIIKTLSEFGIEAEPEVKIGHHICDVLVKYNGMSIPIEFQCSPITIDEVCDRARAYDTIHYWIFGGHYLDHARKFVEWKDGKYLIQKITKLEQHIGSAQPLIYFDYKKMSFFEANWKTRKRSKFLGWYNLRKISPFKVKQLCCGELCFGGPFSYLLKEEIPVGVI